MKSIHLSTALLAILSILALTIYTRSAVWKLTCASVILNKRKVYQALYKQVAPSQTEKQLEDRWREAWYIACSMTCVLTSAKPGIASSESMYGLHYGSTWFSKCKRSTKPWHSAKRHWARSILGQWNRLDLFIYLEGIVPKVFGDMLDQLPQEKKWSRIGRYCNRN